MSNILEKLAAISRPATPITLSSKDGEQTLELLYIRPTLIQDTVLQKALVEEYEEVLASLKKPGKGEGEVSIFDKLVSQFTMLGYDSTINYLIKQDLPAIRSNVLRENVLEPLAVLPEDATDEEKAQHKEDESRFMDVFRPAFDKAIEEARVQYKEDNSLDELAVRAATLEIEARSMARSSVIHKRRLIAESIYYKDEDDDMKVKKLFTGPDHVAEFCTEDTVNTLSRSINEELEALRNLPFNLAAKK